MVEAIETIKINIMEERLVDYLQLYEPAEISVMH